MDCRAAACIRVSSLLSPTSDHKMLCRGTGAGSPVRSCQSRGVSRAVAPGRRWVVRMKSSRWSSKDIGGGGYMPGRTSVEAGA
eukprot:11774381-Heterocapsa_arctica.AAC.1